MRHAGALRFPVKTPPVVRPTTLVVDDDPMCRELTACTLRKKGFHVIEAKDGFEGIGMLLREAGALALLVVDTEMPGVHGWEVIRFAWSKAPRARILRLGRPDDQPPGIEYQALQAVPVLRKPFTEAELLASLSAQVRWPAKHRNGGPPSHEIGRASCRERV